ncbi:hypothetical protein P3G55_09865 [Leptospira sp. 96542]|nr:hypothetical protein [Leptospira sp. 96542]
MYNQITIGFVLVFLSISCGKDVNPADTAPELSKIPDLSGEWILEWEGAEQKLEFQIVDNKVVSNLGFEYKLELDSLGVRVQALDEETLSGYFLYSDMKPNSWIGTWQNRVVRLVRMTPQ